MQCSFIKLAKVVELMLLAKTNRTEKTPVRLIAKLTKIFYQARAQTTPENELFMVQIVPELFGGA